MVGLNFCATCYFYAIPTFKEKRNISYLGDFFYSEQFSKSFPSETQSIDLRGPRKGALTTRLT